MDRQINQMWRFLDDLAHSDPAAYKAYIKDMENQARTAGRIIQPGFSVLAKARNDDFKHTLNICKSKAVEKCSDSLNIPTLMSEQRKLVAKDGTMEYVYDAVFHDSVFDRDDVEGAVLDLAASCVEELFQVSLIRSSCTITKNSYYGPYGWNDKKGQPLTNEEWEQKLSSPDSGFPTSLKEAQELLFGGEKPSSDSPSSGGLGGKVDIITRPPVEEEESALPELLLPLSKPHHMSKGNSNKTLIEELDISSPYTSSVKKSSLIQELDSDVGTEATPCKDTSLSFQTPKDINSSVMTVPSYTVKYAGLNLVVSISLPDIKSSDEIEYTPLDHEFQVSAGNKYSLKHSLPSEFDSETASAKFIIKKQKLKLTFYKS